MGAKKVNSNLNLAYDATIDGSDGSSRQVRIFYPRRTEDDWEKKISGLLLNNLADQGTPRYNGDACCVRLRLRW